ncbi:hypothetical protein FOS14_03445 [Skermania sp. ID1734]|uniref:hypothetical protein n=1 Tax=Skermania sp. ID1734 TaxID=2597516 RepID=UPI00117D7F68|nr:hypothetical protein [Skermania sp. ID1734]TSE01600.1 hypothetical protein FOS14_03445 [Skermania sp. ID1734]
MHRGYLGEHCFFTNEECWYLGAKHAYRGDALPFDPGDKEATYTLEIEGDPGRLSMQLTTELTESTGNPITTASVHALVDSVASVCAAEPGVLIDDAAPYYRNLLESTK